jgi:hypothetical protein
MSARTPRASVLIPCFDKAAHVEETLRSVFAQTFDDWELIVVDDGSTDGSLEILRGHADRLQLVTQDNRGPAVARQRAFEVSRGRYVQYLDADDVLAPNALARRVEAIEASGADVAYADWQRLVPGTAGAYIHGEVVARTIEDIDADPEVACFTRFWCPPAALLYTRDICTRIAWSAHLRIGEDARYLLDAAAAGARFVHVPGVSALYREDPGSLSRRSVTLFFQNVFRNAEDVCARWSRDGTLTPPRRCALVACYVQVARAVFRTDPALFYHARARIARLGGRSRWVSAATLLDGALGHEAALSVLAMLRRPAP